MTQLLLYNSMFNLKLRRSGLRNSQVAIRATT
jgi:hypothetical protein